MKKRKKNILLYLIIVIVPTMIGVGSCLHIVLEQDMKERTEDAKRIATIHQRNWDQFISETVTTLEILSIALDANSEKSQIDKLLLKTETMDPRYGGVFLLNQHGLVQSGSSPYLTNLNLSQHSYIQEVVRTNDLVISDQLEQLPNGQEIVGIAKPLVDEDFGSPMIVGAHLRVDYMQNIMQMLTPNAEVSIYNTNGESIMSLNEGLLQSDQSIVLPIDRLPWDIEVKIAEANQNIIIKRIILISLPIFILTNILFFFLKYIMLKRQTNLEKKQNELQKLELVGNLAASTAHEIRNPLTGIKGLIQLLGEKHTATQDQYYFSIINDEINRINEIVSEFLILGKPTIQKIDKINLNCIIRELEPLIKSEANLANIDYEVSMPEEPIFIYCNKDQMKQVILNITKNALESMTDYGKLSLSIIRKKQNCLLVIKDTGSGICKEDMDKIFQPFFTSKDSGTGLGLVVCRRIIESFQGEIAITSKESVGTEVVISLPLQPS